MGRNYHLYICENEVADAHAKNQGKGDVGFIPFLFSTAPAVTP